MTYPSEELMTQVDNITSLDFHNGLDWIELQKMTRVNPMHEKGSMMFFHQIECSAQIFLSVIEPGQVKVKEITYYFKKGCVIYRLNDSFIYRISDLISSTKF